MADLNWAQRVAEQFPARDSNDTDCAWAAAKQRLALGQTITGIVVAKAPFGAWIDIGVGFPALLEILVMEGLTPERYRAGDWCPVGSEVTAFVRGFAYAVHQVGLWQVSPGQRDA